ncbi:MAG: hypothetical protein A2W25_07060 [candidate division Zixibacteria bacterium RBG_16_53_22]|nr:MAG: hypothetical protein A2W25_07060 [candidate division Zixibacteria bacterium RBG_16_53_22]
MRAPEVRREALILLAGTVWSAVGVALVIVAMGWILTIRQSRVIPVGVGIAAGVAIHRFGFSRLAAVNLGRIRAQSPGKEKVCLFAFQNWRSYLMIVVMMTMGYALRHSPVPKIYLSPIYLAIGLALLFSSFRYYQAIH